MEENVFFLNVILTSHCDIVHGFHLCACVCVCVAVCHGHVLCFTDDLFFSEYSPVNICVLQQLQRICHVLIEGTSMMLLLAAIKILLHQKFVLQ